MDKLGVDLPLLLSQIVNFSLLAILLNMFLYKPILNALQARSERIRESLDNAEKVKQQLARVDADYDAKLQEARREGQTIISQAQERARAQEAELLVVARNNAAKIEEEARNKAEQDRQQMLRGLQGQLASLVTETASNVLGRELQTKGHDELINKSIDQLGRLN
ncbi:MULTISPECIES: F0F1 ATP synthase subunit B [Herpetosiphon]|uniref:ATP synthase subunit b n=1 Tax=Herpetosiphon geysericola TaxID=70996 RepID=A0A0P6XRB5_9CHLR|nr:MULTISPECIES: F0F1 ATP synthase subunit B [Herpetosiphon]KPL86628.1 ATP F0F1 synthase subunit B [Herpetosiphon geysericola]MBM7844012.1 F-type H+-transporting ATPase subunit b [Herpetosiphon giganteus]